MSDVQPPVPGEEPVIVPVAGLPPSDLIEQTVERAAEKVASAAKDGVSGHGHRRSGYMVHNGILVAVLILIVALFFVRAGDRNVLQHNDRIIRAGIGCLLADLDDHRHTNQFAHKEIAKNINTPVEISQPDVIPLNKEQAQALKKLCEDFVRSGQDSLRHAETGAPANQASPQDESGTVPAP